MNPVFTSINKANWNLKHVETKAYKPYFDKNFKLKKAVDRKPLFRDIKKAPKLHHVNTVEKNHVYLEKGFKIRKNTRPALLKEIKKGNKLRHINKTCDKSAPYIEKIERVPIPESLLKEIDSKGANAVCKLTHVSTLDKSRPKIEKDVKLRKLDREPFLGEVKEGVDLKHVETCDKTKLNLPKNFHMTSMERDQAKSLGLRAH